MEVVASTQLRKLELKFSPLVEYIGDIEQVVRDIYVGYHNFPNPWFRTRSDSNILIVVIGSDRGLCGAFNVELLARVKEMIAEYEREGKKIADIIPVGKKCTSYCRRIYEKEGLVSYSGREDEFARILSEKIISSFQEEKVDNVFIVSSLYKKTGRERILVEKVLPLEFEISKQEDKKVDWIIEPGWESFLSKIIPEYLKYKLLYKLMESRLAEELSRMLAMKYARENGEKMVSDLTIKYHRARQAQITTEILEIIQGVEV
jgi:F-type H+-transporting ATPase subunit gamma